MIKGPFRAEATFNTPSHITQGLWRISFYIAAVLGTHRSTWVVNLAWWAHVCCKNNPVTLKIFYLRRTVLSLLTHCTLITMYLYEITIHSIKNWHTAACLCPPVHRHASLVTGISKIGQSSAHTFTVTTSVTATWIKQAVSVIYFPICYFLSAVPK